MKKTRFLLVLLAVALAAGLTLTSCGDSGSGSNSSGSGGSGSSSLNGTWLGTVDGDNTRIVARNGNFTMAVSEDGPFVDIAKGTYTVSGNTVTTVIKQVNLGAIMGDRDYWVPASQVGDLIDPSDLTQTGTLTEDGGTLFLDGDRFTKQQ